MTHPFTLHDGDKVRFRTIKGAERVGILLRRPYGRRLHAVVRDDSGRLNYLPSRSHIISKETSLDA